MKDLNDTIELMQSQDYKDRFKSEYFQVKIRTEKLGVMLEKWRTGQLTFTPSCEYDLLHKQYVFMTEYKLCLEERAVVEGIDLV